MNKISALCAAMLVASTSLALAEFVPFSELDKQRPPAAVRLAKIKATLTAAEPFKEAADYQISAAILNAAAHVAFEHCGTPSTGGSITLPRWIGPLLPIRAMAGIEPDDRIHRTNAVMAWAAIGAFFFDGRPCELAEAVAAQSSR